MAGGWPVAWGIADGQWHHEGIGDGVFDTRIDVRGYGLRELGRVVSVLETRGHFPPGEGKGKMSASFRAHIYRPNLLKYGYAVTMLFIATGFCKQEQITYTLI